MVETILKYINELTDHTSNVRVDLELDLKNSECVGDWRIETTNLLKNTKLREKELKACVKFLNVAIRASGRDSEGAEKK